MGVDRTPHKQPHPDLLVLDRQVASPAGGMPRLCWLLGADVSCPCSPCPVHATSPCEALLHAVQDTSTLVELGEITC
jgi:hypothetical protein